jgi:hypothetical protein
LHFCFVKCMADNYVRGEMWRCSGAVIN